VVVLAQRCRCQCLEFVAGIGGTANSGGAAASAEFGADDPYRKSHVPINKHCDAYIGVAKGILPPKPLSRRWEIHPASVPHTQPKHAAPHRDGVSGWRSARLAPAMDCLAVRSRQKDSHCLSENSVARRP
jgi:hypothetical protein